MTPHNSWNTPWDDGDVVSVDDSSFDAFEVFLPAQEGVDAQTSLDPHLPQESGGDDAPLTFLFTAANPAETISVTATMGGQIVNIELFARSDEDDGNRTGQRDHDACHLGA